MSTTANPAHEDSASWIPSWRDLGSLAGKAVDTALEVYDLTQAGNKPVGSVHPTGQVAPGAAAEQARVAVMPTPPEPSEKTQAAQGKSMTGLLLIGGGILLAYFLLKKA